MDRAEALRRVGAAPVARLATVTPKLRPHLVAITFAIVEEHVVHVVDDKPKRSARLQRVRNLEVNPWGSILVDHYSDDWGALWWVRIDGVADVVDEGPLREAAVTALAGKYHQYRGHRPEGPVIAVHLDRVSWWEGS